MLRWVAKNFRTFLWAFVLAVTVWVSAVTAADPDEVRQFPSPIQLEVVGQAPNLVLTGSIPKQVLVTLRAPRSVWERLTTEQNAVRTLIDLSGLGAGQHSLEVQVQIAIRPVRIVSTSPASVNLTLEPLVTRTLPVGLSITGEPAIGYQAGEASLDPRQVVVSGPESLADQVSKVRVSASLAGAREGIDQSLPVEALDQDNQTISGLTINPDSVHVTIPLSQQGGYRDMAVKVNVQGQQASGYRLANISVFPPVVTVFSSDPQLVSSLPGVVETEALDLNGASDGISTRLNLNLPTGVSVVGDQSVLVQVGITPIQSSLTLSNQKIEVIGLSTDLQYQVSPETVDVILSGPLPSLDALKPQDVRVTVDATGLGAGTHQLEPQVEVLVSDILVESILPATIEVVLAPLGTTTPTPTPQP
jgi:YbbR domain-containing protein